MRSQEEIEAMFKEIGLDSQEKREHFLVFEKMAQASQQPLDKVFICIDGQTKSKEENQNAKLA